MKKTLFLTIIFCAICILPFSVSASGIISAFNVEPLESTVGEVGDYGLEVVLTGSVASGTTMAFLFMDENSQAADSFDVSTGSLIDGDLTGAIYSTDGPANVYIQVNQDLSAGTYNFGFSDITNSSDAGTYKLGMGFGTNFGTATDYTESNTFNLVDANPFTALTFSLDSNFKEVKTDGSFGFTTTGLSTGDEFYIMFGDSLDTEPEDMDIDFSNASFSSSDGFNVSCSTLGDMTAMIVCSVNQTVPAGTHTLTFTKAVNPSVVSAQYFASVTAEQPSPTANFTRTDLYTYKNIGKLKKKKILIKKKKSGRPLIKIKKRKLDTNWNKVKLYGKNKKKWERVKTKSFKSMVDF